MTGGAVSRYTHTKPGIVETLKLASVYLLMWALLSENQGWGFGVLFVALALLCARLTGLRLPVLAWRHVPAFLWFFLRRLVAGGVDVALRTIPRTPAISPAWMDCPLQDGSEHVRDWLAAIVGLLPGTLAARTDGASMRVHVLDTRREWQADIGKLERHLVLILGSQEETR